MHLALPNVISIKTKTCHISLKYISPILRVLDQTLGSFSFTRWGVVAMNGPKVDPETGVKIEAGVLDAERVEVSAERYSVDD